MTHKCLIFIICLMLVSVCPPSYAELASEVMGMLPKKERGKKLNWTEYKKGDWHVAVVWVRDDDKLETRAYAYRKDSQGVWYFTDSDKVPFPQSIIDHVRVNYSDQDVDLMDCDKWSAGTLSFDEPIELNSNVAKSLPDDKAAAFFAAEDQPDKESSFWPLVPVGTGSLELNWTEYKKGDWHVAVVWTKDAERIESQIYALKMGRDGKWAIVNTDRVAYDKDRMDHVLLSYSSESVMLIDEQGLLIKSLILDLPEREGLKAGRKVERPGRPRVE